jgi:BirA family biotin operon repressor/biotin-[acetyl-CoA-carboxylase] ligase
MPVLPAHALQPRRLMAALAGHAIGAEIQVHEELGSTSDYARELGLAGHPHGLVVFAESQTAGRGRRDNRWSSEPGMDLAVSILLRPEARMEHWPRVTTLAALAICRAMETVASAVNAMIKWPNDVYLDDRKSAGILAETFAQSDGAFMVLGIGVNVNTMVYPPELSRTATSLKLASGREVDRNAFAIALLKALDRIVPLVGQSHGFAEALHEVRQRSWLMGKALTALVDGREVRGVAAGLNDEGHLLVRDERGVEMALSSAEQVRPAA